MRGGVYAQSKMADQPWITTLEGIIQQQQQQFIKVFPYLYMALPI